LKRRIEKPPQRKETSPLQELEARIEAQERVIAALEAELSEDWGDVDRITAHTKARADLQALLERWEALMDEVPS
jgi:uncharacterized coiled-coil protein SlyX